jgi:hypothetical protein
MEVSNQPYPLPFCPRETALCAGWDPVPVWTLWVTQKSLVLTNLNRILLVRSLATLPTELEQH